MNWFLELAPNVQIAVSICVAAAVIAVCVVLTSIFS